MSSHYVLHDTYSEPYLSMKIQTFRHIHVLFRPIQPYGGIFKTLCSSWIFRTLPYSESWHKYIFRTLSKHILAYSVGCVTLAFWKNCFIQNFAIFRISALGNSRHIQNPVYLGTFRHVQTYSIMIIWTIFLHFFFFFSYSSTEFEKTYMLDRVYLNNTWSLKQALE